MQEQPPYLFDPGDEHISVIADPDGAVIDVAVRGVWAASLNPVVSRTLRKCLAGNPAGIVFDLSGIEDPEPASVPTWLGAVRATAVAEPAARFAVCLPPGSPRLGREGGDDLPIHTTLAEAHAALAQQQSPGEFVRLSLPPAASSPGVARDLIGGACQDWDMSTLLLPARAVMSELVTNAVEHAGTRIDVAVSRRGTTLHIAVRDRDPRLPRVLDLAPVRAGLPLDERGRGLRVVHADSTAWGALPTADGKLVWATVRDRAGQPRRW
ncbi:ATP-binding protein [Actinoplanes sp. NPDC051346]|uniref:ATP-binding protein n=1 Tax=Actinoplanes sp. NPDC051346 TaxID=3155048 RepID=UPI0034134D30